MNIKFADIKTGFTTHSNSEKSSDSWYHVDVIFGAFIVIWKLLYTGVSFDQKYNKCRAKQWSI